MTHPLTPLVSRGRAMNEEAPTWRERLEALRYVPPLVRMIWRTHRGYTSSMLILRFARAFVPVSTFWVGKLILDTVLAARAGHATYALLWKYVAFEIALVLTGEILARVSSLIESLLSDLFSNDMSVKLMAHAATLDLAQFEDPNFYDHLERARRQTVGRIALLTQVVSMSQDGVT